MSLRRTPSRDLISLSLSRLAKLRGVAASYTDAWGHHQKVADETLVRVLTALGEPLERPGDAIAVLDARPATGARFGASVVVAWDGVLSIGDAQRVAALLAGDRPDGGGGRANMGDLAQFAKLARQFAVQLEEGDVVTLADVLARAHPTDRGESAGRQAGALSFGLHVVRRAGSGPGELPEALVISAPSTALPLSSPSWGVFAPTYALVDGRGLAKGDLTSLETLGRLAAGWGARYLVTLPLLAQMPTPAWSSILPSAGPAQGPSPYSPVSRAFWDESYLDLARLPELGAGWAGQAGGSGGSGGSHGPHGPHDPHGPHGPGELRTALGLGAERLARALGGHPALRQRAADYRRYVTERRDVFGYGRFMAQVELGRGADNPARNAGESQPSRSSPSSPSSRVVDPDTLEAAARRYVYGQWAMDAQVGEVAATLADLGVGLVLDLPVGCRGDGYDPWAHPGSFSMGATIGAPPDDFFPKGQNWGLAPIHPDGERASFYPVVRSALGHVLRHAKVVRVDHVAGWQRLWWIPAGAAPSEGAYVAYPQQELAALACLAAWRKGASLVGEDLGTVDPDLRRLLGEHGVAGMDVAVFSLGDPLQALPAPRPGCMAMLDTHDTATVAGFAEGDDIALRERLGLLDGAQAEALQGGRRATVRRVTEELVAEGLLAPCSDSGVTSPAGQLAAGLLESLGRSQASVVVANLEDLWGERDPQNVPGTTVEHANFQRPMALSLEQIAEHKAIADALTRLDRARAEVGPTTTGAVAGAGAPLTRSGAR